ncbi:hypothetical protein Phum_PHUM416930 [Pediculus humanus corporis]|uniref:F-box domain-containing protein n=1 Tax=Pediculus humanus subsp. corporis TaxID=121224 RepID=E0VSC7_PEDHC|nr:uncharacterized protein Phum_PHUM416930 [Pediculus humanus corporis]EEB16283.1 hypothetical protein Phum_PHUM416930 [Pediculus humanus corporis]
MPYEIGNILFTRVSTPSLFSLSYSNKKEKTMIKNSSRLWVEYCQAAFNYLPDDHESPPITPNPRFLNNNNNNNSSSSGCSSKYSLNHGDFSAIMGVVHDENNCSCSNNEFTHIANTHIHTSVNVTKKKKNKPKPDLPALEKKNFKKKKTCHDDFIYVMLEVLIKHIKNFN